jgi:hypothetical protein
MIDPFSPVTALDLILGQLWIWTDRSAHLSTIDINDPRGEEETQEVGCIGRFCISKVDKVVFFLSADGLSFMESSGVVDFPAKFQSELLTYLREEISGQPLLANASRASMQYLRRRKELWLYMPSSVDIGGDKPAKIFIVRFFGSVAQFVCYSFELTEDGNPPVPVLLQRHSDGTLWASHTVTIGGNELIRTFNNDATSVWQGVTALEKSWSDGKINLVKQLRTVDVTADIKAIVKVMTGAPNNNGFIDDTYGRLNTGVTIYPMSVTGDDYKRYRHVPDSTPLNSTAHAPMTRFITQPDLEGSHRVIYKGISVAYAYRHRHP